jgi:hypothetical protein
MNDAPSSSVAARPASAPPPSSDERHADGAAREEKQQRKRNRDNFQRKRVELLDDLLRSLDILVYAELSTIYYME